jgi:hypothetical protein
MTPEQQTPASVVERDTLDLYDEKVQEGISWTMRQWGEALGLTTWTQGDGSESVEGDVGAEIHTILVDAGLRDPETNEMARLATQGESRQTGSNGEVLKVACDHCQRMTRVPAASIAIAAARGATYSGPFDLEWLRAGLSKRDIEVSEGYSPAVAALVALDHYRGALEGNPLADPSCLSPLPAAPTPADGGGE